jgi:adenylate cyclase
LSDSAGRQRLAAILAADVVGYSRLMSMDDHATLAALDAARGVFRGAIESHRGRVIDMAGDSVLAVFETATGAVTAALAIQETLNAALAAIPEDRRMRFRIGVHLGDVLEKVDGTVYGDGVNIAARLEGLAVPGGVVVSDAVHGAVRARVAANFADLGPQQVKNIAHPVRAFSITPAGSSAARPQAPAAEGELPLPEKPSIAVLPFNNMSGDPEQEYFADGVVEDIITALSRFRSLFVIARNSSFSYKGKSPDIRQVAKELGVRYVLEGSIRRAGNRIRVTGQLIDASTGNHIWAERYDRVLEDIFAVQEELTTSIVAAIAPQIDAAEQARARRRRPESLSAYEIALRAYANSWEAYLKSDRTLCETAIREAKEALAIDPASTLALCTVAWCHWQSVFFRTAADREAAWREGMAAASKAVELDRFDSVSHVVKGGLLNTKSDRLEEALVTLRRAHELNPNDQLALFALGRLEASAGDVEQGILLLSRALRISPLDPMRYNMHQLLANALFRVKDYTKALEHALLAAQEAAASAPVMLTLCVCHVGLTEIGRARAALDMARRLAPEYVQARLDAASGLGKPEHRRRITTFLRVAAGLEEAGAADALR